MARSSMWSALARIFCSAHVGTGSETTVEQESQQVRASGIDSQKCGVDHDTPFDYPIQVELDEIPGRIPLDLDGMADIIISEQLSRAIRGECEYALVGSETDSNNEPESKLIIVDGGCTTSLTSSFENCADCKPRITSVRTAEGGMTMQTTHVCMKTYYVRSRTGEIRPITTKAFICPTLRTDLLSVKGLNFQGYSIIHHPDPEESGVFPLIKGKTDKSQSFAFMSEHSNLFYLKAELMSAQQFGKTSGYEKWHRRLGHTSNKDIQDTIKHVIGLEELLQTSYEKHTKCASCMIGKSTLEDFPGEKIRADRPLKQVNIDSFSSSVVSIEGYFHAVVIVDCHTGYRWLYGMKTRDEMLQVVKRWYGDIADLRQKHTLVVAMRDNAGENKSKEIMEFFDSVGVRNHFSTSHEQWQNGLAEAAINSIMRLARTVMAESGLGGRFWFKAACAGKDARNVTYKQRLGSTPYTCMYGEVKNVSRFRAFGCRAWVHLNSERREKGKHTPRALEAIYLGFEPNTSSWCFFIPERQTLWSTNQAKFDEYSFPFRRRSMVDKFQHSENSCDILYQTPSQVKWEPYNKLHISNYKKVHYDVVSDVMVLQVNTRENTFV